MAWFNMKKQKKQIIPLMNELIKMMSSFNGGSLGIENKQALNKIFGRSPYYKMLVSKRGQDIAKIQLYLKDLDNSENKNVFEHELLDVLNKPNSEMVGIQLRKLTAIYYDNLGEWLWWLSRNYAGDVIAMYPINPADIIVRGSETEEWQISTINGVQNINNKDVIYCKDINPAEPYGRGIGQGQSTSDELSIAEKISKLIGVTFDNKAVPPFIINFKGVSETEVEAAQSKWLDKFKGIANYAKPMFTNADIDIKKLAYTFEESKVVELGDKQREQFRQIWGIPKELIGDLGDSNKASSTNAYNIYAENVLTPAIELFTQVLQYSLIKEYNERNGTNLKLCYKNPNKADEEFVLNVIKSNPFAFKTNEIRVLAHHDEWEDGRGDQIFVPLNMISNQQNGNINRDNFSNKINSEVDVTPEEKSRKEISFVIKKKINLIKQDEEEEKINNEKAIEVMLLLALLTPDEFRIKLQPIYLFLYNEEGIRSLDELESNVDFISNNYKFNDFFNAIVATSIPAIIDTITGSIRKTVQQAIKDGLTIDEVRNKLKEDILNKYTENNGYKLEQIVETEATSLVNYARQEAAIQSGLALKKEWLTQRDGKVRESHLIDGQTKPLNEMFDLNSGNKAMYPGDPSLPAEDRVNERCFLAYNTGQNSLAGETEDQRTAYWNNQRATIESYKNKLKEVYKSIFQELENKTLEIL